MVFILKIRFVFTFDFYLDFEVEIETTLYRVRIYLIWKDGLMLYCRRKGSDLFSFQLTDTHDSPFNFLDSVAWEARSYFTSCMLLCDFYILKVKTILFKQFQVE